MEQGKSISDKILEGLKKAQQEIEELLVQFSLGKLEAKDKFEELKKDLASSIHKWKQKYSVDQKSERLRKLFEELELQLALGKAEANDKFEEQKKKILEKLHELENEIKSDPRYKDISETIKLEFAKFKLKLDILQLKFKQKKTEYQNEFESEFNNLKSNFNAFYEEKSKKVKSGLSGFSEEMEQAFEHFRKAVQSFGKKQP